MTVAIGRLARCALEAGRCSVYSKRVKVRPALEVCGCFVGLPSFGIPYADGRVEASRDDTYAIKHDSIDLGIMSS